MRDEDADQLSGGKHHVRRRRWPAVGDSVAALQSIAGLTFSGVYRMKDTTSPLVDSSGNGNSLALIGTGTPTFGATVGDRVGVEYDASDEGHRSNVLPIGLSSALILCVFIPPSSTSGYHGVCGRVATGAVQGVYAYCESGANTLTVVWADGTNTRAVTSTANVRTPQVPIMLGIQVDRTATTGRARLSRRGTNLDAFTGSISGHGTYTTASQNFGIGGFAQEFSIVGGCKVSFVAVATGAQCEGANLLADTFRRLKFE